MNKGLETIGYLCLVLLGSVALSYILKDEDDVLSIDYNKIVNDRIKRDKEIIEGEIK